MKVSKKDIKYQLARKLFEYYVINDKYVAVQMPDGRYIPRRITCSPMLIYDMIKSGSSLGTYQQQYGKKWIKWICLDFDCKEPVLLPQLLERFVLPAAADLDNRGIRFLAEFSGRRGIHLWVLLKGIISKAQGYQIAEELTVSYRNAVRSQKGFGLDIFPAAASGGMKFGKQVKLPLSVHRKGGQSFFIPDILEMEYQEWMNLPENPDFWKGQLEVLQKYVPNDPEEVWRKLRILPEQEEQEKWLLYRKEYVIGDKKLSLEEIKEKCTDSSVFSMIMQWAEEGNLKYLDRLVLAGCFGNFQNKELLLDIMRQQKNYKEKTTRQYLAKMEGRYYPVTLQYLYDLYGEELEPELDPRMTLLEYVAEKFDFPVVMPKIVEKHKAGKEKDGRYFAMIRDKELRYMEYDDEVLSVNDYLRLSEMKQYDFKMLMERYQKIIEGAETDIYPMTGYSVYMRQEEGKKEPRMLVSLCPEDRVLTTALIYELVEIMGGRMDSYSYNLNFFYESSSVFMPWYDSWKRFQQDVECYLYLDIFKESGLIKLDLTNFYDSIYIQALFQQMEEIHGLSYEKKEKQKIDNILRYLGSYTENLMRQIKEKIRGVPQGPAYARVFAEMFLTAVITSFLRKYEYEKEDCRILRYVDDMFIVYRGIDGDQLLQQFSDYLFARGLSINWNKSVCFGRIADMKENEKRSIFEDGAANYEIKSIQELELEDEDEQQEKLLQFEKYLRRKGDWSIRDANFILNRYLDPIFVETYLDQYAEILIGQNVGRGSIYKRLYEEILKRDEWMVRFFRKGLYNTIPENSVNFQNFISVCYFQISRIQVLTEKDKEVFIEWLKQERMMCLNDTGTVHAIIHLLEGVV